MDGTLVVGRGGDSVMFDSGPATDGESAMVIQEIIEPLVRLAGTHDQTDPLAGRILGDQR